MQTERYSQASFEDKENFNYHALQGKYEKRTESTQQRVVLTERINQNSFIPSVLPAKTFDQQNAENYGQHQWQNLKNKEKQFKLNDFLSKHKITGDLRAKMIDWMVEVLTAFKQSDQVLFLAIRYMDTYFEKETRQIQLEELHGIGVACMFIASKYEEVIPLKLKVVQEKIAHKKITSEQIRQIEMQILDKLDYKICIPHAYEFLTMLIYLTKPNQLIIKTANVILHLGQHLYEFSAELPSVQAISALCVAYISCGQLDKVSALTQYSNPINLAKCINELYLAITRFQGLFASYKSCVNKFEFSYSGLNMPLFYFQEDKNEVQIE